MLSKIATTLKQRTPLVSLATSLALCCLVAACAAPGTLGQGSTGGAGTGGNAAQTLARPSFLSAETLAASQVEFTPAVQTTQIEDGLANVAFTDAFYLEGEARSLLEKNGFVVNATRGDDEFFTLYEDNRYNYIPNFVTVDSMMHTYHLYFQHLLKNTERSYLLESLLALSQDMLATSTAQLTELAGTEWEEAARANAAFFAVGASLLDPSIKTPAEIDDIVSGELANIEAASGPMLSPLLGGDNMEDYSQYIVRGYYAEDENLSRYFRAMMWFGRMNFRQSDERLNRCALLMTLALSGESLERWQSIYAITSFFAGASDDCGYYEYLPLVEEAYGKDIDAASLAGKESEWAKFCELTSQLEPPKINSVVVMDTGTETDHLEEEKGFRFMGQRFSIDAEIFTQLVYNRVGTEDNQRMLPNALDIPAALGSDTALSILDELGETNYKNYSENMEALRTQIGEADDSLWNASLYSKWLNTLNPLLEEKGEGYPSYMQTEAWARKNLQSYLGSYTELKHDTVLYSKQVMAEMGAALPPERDDRGYVEAEPEVFARLSGLVAATSEGLDSYDMLSDADRENLELLHQLADQLKTIAVKELEAEALSDDEYELIRSYGAQLEHFWQEVYKNETPDEYLTTRDFPAAIVTDVATGDGEVLQLGTGRASEIIVVVEVDGQLKLASGTVYSFYQFHNAASARMTDAQWREILNGYESPYLTEEWTSSFQLRERVYS